MQKKAILALMLVVAMLMTGCALIEKDADVDRQTEIITVTNPTTGEKLSYTKGEIMSEVDYYLQYYAYIYSMYGYSYDATDAQNISDAKDTIVSDFIQTAVLTLKAKELGMDQLTDEENASVAEQVATTWNGYVSQVQASYFNETTATDLSVAGADDALLAQVEAKMVELAYPTKDELTQNAVESQSRTKLENSVRDAVTVSEEELKTGYDEKVAADQTTYGAEGVDKTAYGTAVNGGTTTYWAPEGYRMVKHVLLKFLDEDQSIITALTTAISDKATEITTLTTSLTDALGVGAAMTAEEAAAAVKVEIEEPAALEVTVDETTGEITTPTDLPVATTATVKDVTADFGQNLSEEAADLAKQLATAQAEKTFLEAQLVSARENGWAHLSEKAQEVITKANAGEDFNSLIDSYSQDTGMASGSTAYKNGGYAVCDGFTSFDSDFLAGAMALEKAGDVSGEVKTQFGIHIIQYASDVTPGAAALETVKDALEASLLSTKQDTTWNEQIATWTSEAKVKNDRSALDD